MNRIRRLATSLDRRTSLALKVGIPVVVISVLAVGTLGAFAVSEAKQRIDETYASEAQDFSRVIRAQFATVRDLPDSLQRMDTFLQEFERTHPAVHRVRLLQETAQGGGIVWASSLPEDVGVPVDTGLLHPLKPYLQTDSQFAGEPSFLHVQPVEDFGEGIRSISYDFSTDARNDVISKATRQVSFASLVVVLAELAALAGTVYLVVLRRTRRLRAAAQRVAAGDLSVTLPEGSEPPSRDELVQVAREFDNMVGEIRRAFDQEREQAQKLRELDEVKTTILHAVSHDLRSPITSVLGSAVTLERNTDLSDADRAALLHGVVASARKMHRMVSDLLDLDRLDKGIAEPARELTDLGVLAARVVDEIGTQPDHPIHLHAEPVTIAVDGPKVERILDNLIANSIRHTKRGTEIWIDVAAEDGGALLRVEDAGTGVPEALRQSIFEPFRQGSDAAGGGAGIGLSLVARFAEIQGGRAWVEDRTGGGASFRVFLPDGPAEPTASQLIGG